MKPINVLLAAASFEDAAFSQLITKLFDQLPDLFDALGIERRAGQRLWFPSWSEWVEKMKNLRVFNLSLLGSELIIAVRFIDHNRIGQLDDALLDTL